MLRVHVVVWLSDVVLCPPLDVPVSVDATADDVIASIVHELQHQNLIVTPFDSSSVRLYNDRDRGLLSRVNRKTTNLLVAKRDPQPKTKVRRRTVPKRKKNNKSTHQASVSSIVDYWLLIDDTAIPLTKRWEDTTPLPPLCVHQEQRVWFFPEALTPSTLGPMRNDLWFCRRDVCEHAWAFIADDVLRDGAFGWLWGALGSGKSSIAMAFAITQATDWVVTWFDCNGFCWLYRFADGSCKSVHLRDDDEPGTLHDLRLALDNVPPETNHLVILTRVYPAQSGILEACKTWLTQSRDTRQLLVTAPLESCELLARSRQQIANTRSFFVSSWTLDEDVDAVAHDGLFQSAEKALDSNEVADGVDLTREDRVRAKFYFAGGNARSMFRANTELCENARGSRSLSSWPHGKRTATVSGGRQESRWMWRSSTRRWSLAGRAGLTRWRGRCLR